ncbi:hypothetical protein [Chelatococcus asaccharovorans]|uniref:Uncharacterized protein n=1 Tax=Chelatococcus asaccharovorans TaxID=28210 RepID=A0A2V3TQ66_9HYPH|nr:hypothetical protein [Chelatococcus asaccharovorans]MBS7704537.1 hypothetical protein [Chelatococcus asaccharovorans]PXW50311.1 hypothetical protein C7450_1289 [Chelatococcus asaccharovorans]
MICWLKPAIALCLAFALASCGSYGAGFAALPETSGWERLPVGRWLVEGIAPETMVVCRRPACADDAMVASFLLPDRLEGGADALRKAIFPNGFPRRAAPQAGAVPAAKTPPAKTPPAKTAAAKSRDEVKALDGTPFTGLVVTMRATADPNRHVVAVIAERPRPPGMEVVVSIAAREATARTNALKALGPAP